MSSTTNAIFASGSCHLGPAGKVTVERRLKSNRFAFHKTGASTNTDHFTTLIDATMLKLDNARIRS
jgi:hypothetical protein